MPAHSSFKVWSTDNLIYGPVDLPTLIQWVEEGRVHRDTWVHDLESNDWLAGGAIPELAAAFDGLGAAPESEPSARAENGSAAAIKTLRELERFAPYSDDELAVLLTYCEVTERRQGDLIIKKGDMSDAMFLVLEGSVRARVKVGGHDSSLGTIGPGELFGEVAMLSQRARSADVVAESPARLLKLAAEQFQILISDHPQLGAKVLFNLSRQLAGRLAERNVELQKDLASGFVWR